MTIARLAQMVTLLAAAALLALPALLPLFSAPKGDLRPELAKVEAPRPVAPPPGEGNKAPPPAEAAKVPPPAQAGKAAAPAGPVAAIALLSSAPSVEAAKAKWAKLVKAVPALAKRSPLTTVIGDPAKGGYVGLRLSGARPELERICAALTAKGQFCELRGAPPPVADGVQTAPSPSPPTGPAAMNADVTMLLSSAKSIAAAKAKWSRLIRAVPALARQTPKLLTVGDLSRGGYVSLRVCGPQRKLANLCVLLTGKGQYCQLHGILMPFHPPHGGK